jgi:hypothetical protein
MLPLLLLAVLSAFSLVSTPIRLVADFPAFRAPAASLICNASGAPHTSLPIPYTSRFSTMALGSPNYDEQLGLSLAQSFSALAYDVTAVAQTDSSGYGPAYLLDGLTDAGYWYQVGLSWNWPSSGSSYNPGFNMIYEVFDPSGNSIFPTFGGGMLSFSGPVHQGDAVLLNLQFSLSDQVEMLASDQNTGAQAYEAYGAYGATLFVGTQDSAWNSVGFFTGLMTEWYHINPYYGDEQKVVYTVSGSGISSAWMWIGEFNAQTRQALFSDSTPSPVLYSNSTQLQKFSSNGAIEYSNAYQFETGSTTAMMITLTLSFAVNGGGSGYYGPTLTYTLNGVQHTANITLFSTAYDVDANTIWYATRQLTGSSSTERWKTNEQTTGNATSSQTIKLVYYHQFYSSLSFKIIDGRNGFSTPEITYQNFGSQTTTLLDAYVWADAGGSYNFQNPLTGTLSTERWFSNSTVQGTITQPSTLQTTYYHQYYVTVQSNISEGGTTTPDSNWFDAGDVLRIAALPSQGWQFEYWSGSGIGSYSGHTNATSTNVDSAMTETANFYPGLTIETSNEITVSYKYGSTTGSIPPNASQTVYVPPGTNITLTADPILFIYTFRGWNGAATTDASEIAMVINVPLRMSAHHSYSYINIALTLAGIIIVAIIVLVAARRRPEAPTSAEMHPSSTTMLQYLNGIYQN